ncbi:hypothetical protein NPIL_619651 [Nephila pilipes]|uniref:Uncharacterized protein n=1 Tax=Nephila pilipes TaxID=299642 RepID=A0A8X6NVB6_NEPPI|nr:hypothetical protein NPIL_619651 [Nephila pilipes]
MVKNKTKQYDNRVRSAHPYERPVFTPDKCGSYLARGVWQISIEVEQRILIRERLISLHTVTLQIIPTMSLDRVGWGKIDQELEWSVMGTKQR